MLRSLRAAAVAAAVTATVVIGLPTPASAATCTATVTITSQWITGHVAELAVSSSTPISTWTVVLTYPNPAPTLGPVWSVTMDQVGNMAVFRPVSWTIAGGGFIGAGTTMTPDSVTCFVV